MVGHLYFWAEFPSNKLSLRRFKSFCGTFVFNHQIKKLDIEYTPPGIWIVNLLKSSPNAGRSRSYWLSVARSMQQCSHLTTTTAFLPMSYRHSFGKKTKAWLKQDVVLCEACNPHEKHIGMIGISAMIEYHWLGIEKILQYYWHWYLCMGLEDSL